MIVQRKQRWSLMNRESNDMDVSIMRDMNAGNDRIRRATPEHVNEEIDRKCSFCGWCN